MTVGALNAAILTAVVLAAAALFHPRLLNWPIWRATVTPLASIIGSGFLILGPVLDGLYGALAPLAMAALCAVAWLFGAAIRFNIADIGDGPDHRGGVERALEAAASWALAFAYVVSVAYYLNLFGAFGVSLTNLDDPFHARLLTTAVFAAILLIGLGYGFRALERTEQVSVGLKLAIIAGLLAGLAISFGGRAAEGSLVANAPSVGPWQAATLGFGLLVTVQGFETSRYLGATYDAAARMRSMRAAQALSAAIYLIYIGLIAYLFPRGELRLSETGIIAMMSVVAPVLPALLVAAALSAQFSAAVADTSGSGGLVAELTRGRVPERAAYAVLAIAGVWLTWRADVFQIVSYASRAFALYYAIQAAIAALGARRAGRRRLAAGFAALALLGVAIAVLGQAVEGESGVAD